MHEDRLPGAAGRQRRNRGLGRHVLNGVHADAQMRQQRLRQDLAQFIIDGRSTGRHTVTTAIAAERAEEGAMRRAGVHAVQAVDDMQSFLVMVRVHSIGSGSFGFRQRGWCCGIPSGIQVFGSKPWFCMKKMTRFGFVLLVGDAMRRSGKSEAPNAAPAPVATPCSMFSAVEHDRSFWEINGQLCVIGRSDGTC